MTLAGPGLTLAGRSDAIGAVLAYNEQASDNHQ